MLGAIIGDMIGSPYEFGAEKTKDFYLLSPSCCPTDDSMMTIAVGCACAEADLYDEDSFKTVLCEKMREIGRLYPDAGYGERFYRWLMDDNDTAYHLYDLSTDLQEQQNIAPQHPKIVREMQQQLQELTR